jgi:hypothetical protein
MRVGLAARGDRYALTPRLGRLPSQKFSLDDARR